MTFPPPNERPGMAEDGKEAVKKVLTWCVLSMVVTFCFVLIVAMLVGLGKAVL